MSVMHRDTVTLYNYIGEVDHHASYSLTVLKCVDCDTAYGTKINSLGKVSDDKARLYIFDKYVRAESSNGDLKQYMPYGEWQQFSEKENYWTINPNADDYFVKGIVTDTTPPKQAFRITAAPHYIKGSPRMWHWEVNGA